MPDLPAIKALADAGGWAVCILLIALIGIGATKRFRWWVPGWIYEDERTQRGIAETQAERTIKAIEKQAAAYIVMARKHDRVADELALLRQQMVNRD